mgnify:CR=1 FL=1
MFKHLFNNNKGTRMRKITKLFLGILASALLVLPTYAGELAVTGGAKVTYTTSGAVGSEGKSIGVSNELDFSASGELDNGMTWDYQVQLDGASTANDDTKLVIGTDMGTIGFFDSEGGLSQELGYGIGALGTGYDWGGTMTVQAGLDVSSHPNIQYHLPADLLPFGMSAKVGYAPNMTDGQGNSFKNSGPINHPSNTGQTMTGMTVGLAPVDGLKIGADYHYTDGQLVTTAQDAESGNYYAQYAMGNFKIGYNKGYYAPGLTDKNTAVTEYENTSMGIEIAVNDALSFSYNDEEFSATTNNAIAAGASTNTKTIVDSEHESIQVAYVMGGATLGLAIVEVDNADYVANKEEKKTIFTIAMDF